MQSQPPPYKLEEMCVSLAFCFFGSRMVVQGERFLPWLLLHQPAPG